MQLPGDTRPLVGDCLLRPRLTLPPGLYQAGSHRVAADPDKRGDAQENQR